MNNTKKNILLVVVLVLIIGVVWYIESTKVHPGAGAGGPVQTINITGVVPENTSSTMTGTSTGEIQATGTVPTPAVSASLAAIAAADQKAAYQPAIEIADPTGFVNVSSTFTLRSLIGKKVILVDFWTYSCINCIRTLPYLTAWYSKYQNQGLEIVGIHTPEFDFEKDINNVRAATVQYGIQYPVVLDSDYGTWNAYGNLYWPHEYLIDIAGYIVHDHIGEGDYPTTEGVIQQLLDQRDQVLGITPTFATSAVDVNPSNLNGIDSPETYFGAERNMYLANGTRGTSGTQTLTTPSNITTNQLYLGGSWTFDDQYATNNASGAQIVYQYNSSKVYIVASGAATGTTIQVMQDGAPISAAASGSDVKNGILTITGSRLYNIVNNPDGAGTHTLELIVNSPGLEAFTFTFG